MDLETIGASPVSGGGGGVAPKPVRKHEIGHALILGLAACWVAAGLFIAPLATLAWLVCVGGVVGLGAWLANRMDDRIYQRLASGHCAQCGYDLQGCGPRGECPGCGAWFGPGWGAAIPKGKAMKRSEDSTELPDAQDVVSTERETERIEPPDSVQ
jgi:hypothetical protein